MRRGRVNTGRNLPVAVASGVALGALVLVSLFWEKSLFVGVMTAAFAISLWELNRALTGRDIRIAVVPIAVGGVGILVGAYVGGAAALSGVLAMTFVAVMLWRLPRGATGYVRDVAAGTFVTAYLPFLIAFWMLMLAATDGAERIITFIVVTICSDIGGYFAGIFAGRRKMAPTISPKKTWEGFAGSTAACMIGGALTVGLLLDGSYWQGALLGVAIVCAATLGDLIESMVKRDLGIKDMGRFLPGHGGLLDRLDSLLISGPVAWLMLTAFVPPVLP
ncbi:MAG: phosphatidate cytidylyltransferase [Streptosporangiales bacterium]|nr:phosphatidate cytidylyltransferase [Streptosporangiales bacterium]